MRKIPIPTNIYIVVTVKLGKDFLPPPSCNRGPEGLDNGLAAIKGFEIAEQDAEYVRDSLMNAAEEWELVMPEHHQPPGTEVGSETTIEVTDVDPV